MTTPRLPFSPRVFVRTVLLRRCWRCGRQGVNLLGLTRCRSCNTRDW